jgi:hypothetical protein
MVGVFCFHGWIDAVNRQKWPNFQGYPVIGHASTV